MRLRLRNGVVAVQLALLAACAHTERAGTLSSLRKVQPDTTDVRVDNGLEKAVDGYRQFLQETPASELTPEAMRRLADLQLEKEYGVRGTTAIVVDRVGRRAPRRGDSLRATSAPAVGSKPVQLAAPEAVKKISAVAKPSDKAAQPALVRRSTSSGRSSSARLRGRPSPRPPRPASHRRSPVRSSRSSCTTSCSPSSRTTLTATRCFTRRPAPTTSSAGPTTRWR